MAGNGARRDFAELMGAEWRVLQVVDALYLHWQTAHSCGE